MENSHKYFKRDISWLSFNYRVLLEAEDETLPIYERIKFLSIYSSNLEEFYEIRVAEHRGVIMKKNFTEESGAEAEETLAEITEEVNRQQREYYRIFSKVLQELNRQDIYLYQDSRPEPFHEEFVHNFFNEEVFPFLSPVMIQAGDIRTFIRDRRLYLVIRMVKKSKRMAEPEPVYAAPAGEGLNAEQREAVTAQARAVEVSCGAGYGQDQDLGGPHRLSDRGAGREARRDHRCDLYQSGRGGAPGTAGGAVGRQAGGPWDDHRDLPCHLSGPSLQTAPGRQADRKL